MDPRGSSPVLMQAVVKVEQVVLRLQELQRTIAGLDKNPHAKKYDVSPSSSFPPEHGISVQSRCRTLHEFDGCDTKLSSSTTLDFQAGRWKNWSAQSNEAHGIISEILKASKIAKSIATLVTDTLQAHSSSSAPASTTQCQQESPSINDPAQKKPDHTRTCKHAETRDISYLSSTQDVHKSMAAKTEPEKHIHNKSKLPFPVESREVRELDNRSMSSVTHVYKAEAPTAVLSNQTTNVVPCKDSKSAPECCSPSVESGIDTSLAWSGHSDHEQLEEDCNLSMEATEIKSQMPWKFISCGSKGVIFPNRVFTPSPDKHSGHQIESPMAAAAAKLLKPQTPLRRRPSKSLKVDRSFKRVLTGEYPEITYNLLASSDLEDDLNAPASDGTSAPIREILEPSAERILLRKRNCGLGKSDQKDDHSTRRSCGKQLKPMDGNIVKLVAATTLPKNTHPELHKKPVSQEKHDIVTQMKLIMSHSSAEDRGLDDEKQRDAVGKGSECSMRFTEKENKPLLACAPARMFLRDLSRVKDRQSMTTMCSKQLRCCVHGLCKLVGELSDQCHQTRQE